MGPQPLMLGDLMRFAESGYRAPGSGPVQPQQGKPTMGRQLTGYGQPMPSGFPPQLLASLFQGGLNAN